MGNVVLGYDASQYQPDIDYRESYETGNRFCYAKLTEGRGGVDPLAGLHVRGASSAGLYVGGYHFYHPTRTPEEQAKNFLDSIAKYSGLLKLPPVVDVETDDTILDEHGTVKRPGVPSAAIRKDVAIFCTLVTAACKRRVVVYTYPSFAEKHNLGPTLGLVQELWIAHYGVKSPTIPKGWGRAAIWQITGKGRVHPIMGGKKDADLDTFLGDEYDFQAWADKP